MGNARAAAATANLVVGVVVALFFSIVFSLTWNSIAQTYFYRLPSQFQSVKFLDVFSATMALLSARVLVMFAIGLLRFPDEEKEK